MGRRGKKYKASASQLFLKFQFYDQSSAYATVNELEDKELSETALEVAIGSLDLSGEPLDLKYTLSIHNTDKKLEINQLGDSTRQLIYEAAPHSKMVEDFISNHAKQTNDLNFPKKLRSCFMKEYLRLYDSGIYGDELFESIRQAVSSRISDPHLKFAAQAILVHLFIICDIFKHPEEVSNATS